VVSNIDEVLLISPTHEYTIDNECDYIGTGRRLCVFHSTIVRRTLCNVLTDSWLCNRPRVQDMHFSLHLESLQLYFIVSGSTVFRRIAVYAICRLLNSIKRSDSEVCCVRQQSRKFWRPFI